MRVIERRMIEAIRNRKSFRNGNTAVEVGALGNWRVTLHGNLIATGGAERFSVTLAGWPTPTTRSRVNALLRELARDNASVFQRAHEQHFTNGADVRAIDSHEWVEVTRAGLSMAA